MELGGNGLGAVPITPQLIEGDQLEPGGRIVGGGGARSIEQVYRFRPLRLCDREICEATKGHRIRRILRKKIAVDSLSIVGAPCRRIELGQVASGRRKIRISRQHGAKRHFCTSIIPLRDADLSQHDLIE